MTEYLDISSKSHKKISNRMIDYIKRDKSKKLKRLLHKIHPDSKLNSKLQSGLHLACKYGNANSLYVLIKHGAYKKLQDKKGNLPIHYSLKYCLKNPSSANVRDLVTNPFLDSLDILEIPNFKGTTPKVLLNALNKLIYDTEESDTTDSSAYSPKEENSWAEKLARANEDDNYDKFNAISDRYEEVYMNKYNESFDQWADRIFNEYRKRQNNAAINTKKSDTLSKDKRDDDSFENKQLHLKLAPARKIPSQPPYEKVEELLTKTCTLSITAKGLLFTNKSSADSIIDAILKGKTDEKKVIREAIRLWVRIKL